MGSKGSAVDSTTQTVFQKPYFQPVADLSYFENGYVTMVNVSQQQRIASRYSKSLHASGIETDYAPSSINSKFRNDEMTGNSINFENQKHITP